MDSFNAPLWDFSQSPASFSQLADDDFLALLQKQFTPDVGASPLGALSIPLGGVDPSKLTSMPLPVPPPPLSDDSSPSPPSMNDLGSSRRQSGTYSIHEGGDEQLKRKASDEDFEEGPSHKTPHLAKKNSTRPARQDETRLLKRKEQNRAAQRAFRERKEKHVKDLEDKVAALEAKNETTETENEHLRELLKRLQDENVSLKQTSFTFTVPRQTANDSPDSFRNVATTFGTSPGSAFGSTSNASPSASKAATPAGSSLDTPSNFPSDIDFGSLTPFDSSTLSMLDDNGDSTMSYDFGYGQVIPSNTPYKTIASNTMFMSFADPSPPEISLNGKDSTPSSETIFDGTFGQWTGQTQRRDSTTSAATTANNSNSLDELFGGHMFGAQSPIDFTTLMKSPGSDVLSPVNHRSPPVHTPGSSTGTSSSSSNNASPAYEGQDSASSPESNHDTGGCPKTRAEFEHHVQAAGSSMFAPPPPAQDADMPPSVFKTVSGENGPMIMCKGATFPSTEKSDKNVEVLSAWRSITSHPQFKASNIDINELCAEFTDKARCDGTKVVLDAQGVDYILQKLTSPRPAT
ncbi:hypothetical protein BV25DRAFT_1837876 [Artomyces pyxidatus]|uniref:Uncharacterized protein n=1 Tax=Artomyces pyxidatus TaxID=48021 RepID=A0ACB8T4T8_9AGAM|nr:hypothetical protein BV25DRAFT_1837876 [Artomyces pyxidatus]